MASEPRGRILRCACELYVEKGLEGFSMRRLAERLGVSAPALYRHFEGKSHLIFELVGEALSVFGRYLYRALEGESAGERLRLSGEAYLRFALEEPKYYELIFVTPGRLGAAELPGELCSRAAATYQFLVDRVRECMDAGLLRRGEPEAVALTLWAQSHGLVSLYLAGKLEVEREEFEALYRDSLQRILEGLRAGEPVVGGS